VNGGRLIEATDTRLVFVRPPFLSPAPWVVLLGLAFVASGYLVLLSTIPVWAAAVVTALLSIMLAGSGFLALGVLRSRMKYVRRRLVVERVPAEEYREGPRFVATVDGRSIGPASQRVLYEVRHREMVAHVFGLGDQVIMLPYYEFAGAGGGLPADTSELRRATRALLRAERGFDDSYGRESMVPMVQALVRVLDLGPAQTDGDVTAVDRQLAGRPAEGDVRPTKVEGSAALPLIACIWLLWIPWQEAVWFLLVPRLMPLGVLSGTLVVAVAQLWPLFALNAVMQSVHIGPLNAKAEAILAKAARG
jgi:hypothetical protein